MKPPREASHKHKAATQNLDNPGALFPRLHVRETRNAGPRGPPRNKMALYEQLTVPSIKFQKNQNTASTSTPIPNTASTYMPHPQAYPGGYYLPCYIGPAMPYQAMQMMQQTFLSQSTIDLEFEQGELQRVPGEDNSVQVPQPSSCQSNANKAVTSKKVQEDFTVPIFASGTSGATTAEFNSNKRLNHGSPVNSVDNNGDLDNQTDEEATQQQSPVASESSDDSVLDNGTASNKVTAKDIIDAVGEPHFWKMRKAMQRQQRLFQNQVFELHRVTKVQQLISETSLNEEATSTEPVKETLPAPSTTVGKSTVTPIPLPPPSYQPQVPQTMPAPYMGYGGAPPVYGGQWFTPVYPYHHQPPPYHQPFYGSAPYGAVPPFFGGHGGVPFVHYPMPPGYEQQDPRFMMPSYEVTAASYAPPPTPKDREQHKKHLVRTNTGSSGGFDLIQRDTDTRTESPGSHKGHNEAGNDRQRRVAPKASMVTPESAAGILQSIRRRQGR